MKGVKSMYNAALWAGVWSNGQSPQDILHFIVLNSHTLPNSAQRLIYSAEPRPTLILHISRAEITESRA